MRHGCTAAELFKEVVELALLHRTLEGLVSRHQRGQLPREDEQALGLPRGVRAGRDAQRHRQHRTRDQSQWRDVVLADPAAHGEEVRSECGFRVGYVKQGPRLAITEGGAIALADADADHPLAFHRRNDPAACHQRVPRGLGHAIREGAQQRERERDLDEPGAHTPGREARTGGWSRKPADCSQS